MRATLSLLGLLVGAVTIGACFVGPVSPNTSAPVASAPASAAISGETAGQTKLAHFLTADGMHGFVLDRTGAKPKIRIDGQPDIIELNLREDRSASGLRGYAFEHPRGHAVLYLSTSGELRYIQGNDELRATRDRDAQALGTPTISGEPKREKEPYELLREKFAAASVRARFPQYKAEDASNLDKIAEAFSKVDASMWVHYVEKDPNGWIPHAPTWTPSNISGIGYGGGSRHSDVEWNPATAKGLARFGGQLMGFSSYGSQGNHIFLQSLKGYPKPLASQTAGVIWEVDSSTAVFVSLDATRYHVDLSPSSIGKGSPLEAGAGTVASWPAPLQHSLVGIEELSALAKVGGAPEALVQQLSEQDTAWNTCAQKTWKGAKSELDRLEDSGKRARERQVVQQWEEKVRKACKAPVESQEKTLLAHIEERNKKRMSIFEAAKARIVAGN